MPECSALRGLRIRLVAESRSGRGRADAVMETRNLVYLIEFKLGSVDEAIPQILARGYAQPFAADPRRIVLLGAGGFGEKQIQLRWQELIR